MDLAVVVRGRSRWPVVRHGPCMDPVYMGCSHRCFLSLQRHTAPPDRWVGRCAGLSHRGPSGGDNSAQCGIVQNDSFSCAGLVFFPKQLLPRLTLSLLLSFLISLTIFLATFSSSSSSSFLPVSPTSYDKSPYTTSESDSSSPI